MNKKILALLIPIFLVSACNFKQHEELTKEELDPIFKGTVIMTAQAANTLNQMGYGKYIGVSAFSGCVSLEYIYYEGDNSSWKEISIGADNNSLLNANIEYNHTHSYSLCDVKTATYFAEGYINYGFIGVLMFTILLSIFTAFQDKKYWSNSSLDFSSSSYFLLLGLILFIMRGDLLSSFSYTCGFLIGYWVVKKLLIIKL